jgi:acetylornithine deacetylase/succinyl-diaminopimelate desuccinylase-like protein
MTDQPTAPSRRTVLRHAALGAAAFAPGAVQAAASQADLTAVRNAIKADHDTNLKRLRDWIALPTIAAEKRNVEEGATMMMELAREAGFQVVERIPTDFVPGVFATMDNGAKKTLAVYFMYDVKQYDPKEWTSPPLEGRLVDKPGMGKVLVGRGAVNSKGPNMVFLNALKAFRKAGRKPPVNFVLVCEGEEEIGSPHFEQIVRNPKVDAALRKCIGITIPQMGQKPPSGDAVITLGAKGVIELELVSSAKTWGRGPAQDLHSSNKAIVDSPAWRLVEALGTLVTPDGNTPAIDGWFDKVRPLTARDKALIAESAAKRDQKAEMAAMGVQHFVNDLPWQQTLERLAAVPTINIEGLVAGYTGPGGKTILPSRAVAKIDMRLVPNQTRDDCVGKLKAHLAKHGYGDIEVNVTGGYDPTETSETSALIKAELATFQRAGVAVTVYPRSAGSWPGYIFTGAPLSLPAGQFGFGHGSGAHAPDEYILIESSNPKVAGIDDAAAAFADFFYQLAATG